MQLTAYIADLKKINLFRIIIIKTVWIKDQIKVARDIARRKFISLSRVIHTLREFLRMWILFERATCEVQKDTDREWYCVAFLWTTFDIKRNCFQRALFDFSRNWNAKGELQRSKIMFGKYHTLPNFSAARGFFYFPSCFYLACAGK